MPLSLNTIEIDGLRIQYATAGRGAPILLVHGWAQCWKSWLPLMEALAPQYAVYAIDLPGFGASVEPRTAWGTKEYALCVESFANALGLERTILIGHSFGARIARDAAVRMRPRALVLVSMGADSRCSLWRVSNELMLRALRPIAPVLLFKAHRALLSPRESVDTSAVSAVRARRMLAVYSATHRNTKSVEPLSLPIFMLYGTNDPITPWRIGSRVRARLGSGARLVCVAGGHFPHRTDKGIRYIADFLKSLPRSD